MLPTEYTFSDYMGCNICIRELTLNLPDYFNGLLATKSKSTQMKPELLISDATSICGSLDTKFSHMFVSHPASSQLSKVLSH